VPSPASLSLARGSRFRQRGRGTLGACVTRPSSAPRPPRADSCRMALAETTRLPALRLPQLIEFLRRELAPLPGGAIGTVRTVIACVVTLVLCMALQVPDAHLSVWVALRVVTEEEGETLLFGVVALLALTIGLAMSLVLLTVAMDQAWLRFCVMAA